MGTAIKFAKTLKPVIISVNNSFQFYFVLSFKYFCAFSYSLSYN